MTYLQWGGRIRCAPALLSKFILAQGARRERTRMGHSGRTEEPAGSGGGGLIPRGLLCSPPLSFSKTAHPPLGSIACGGSRRARGGGGGETRPDDRQLGD